ncbi:hypothetical protein BDC45DRAFT_563802 [Circinella umbellata]|nr:hypothetical protein BDC45DRAFT_563802 [Circinella umbellata]
MPTVGELNAAREQRNAERRVVVKQENALEMEDRIRALEAQNADLVNRVEAMGDIIARQIITQQVAPSVVNQVNTEIPVQSVPVGRVPTLSGLQRFEISSDDLSKKVYAHFDNQRTKQRRTPERAAARKTSNRRNGRRHTAELESCFSGGEALLQLKYMSDEETDDEYSGGIGKRVVVKRLQWLNEKGKRFFARLDELHPPAQSVGLLRVDGVSNVVLSDDERQQLEEWVVNQ